MTTQEGITFEFSEAELRRIQAVTELAPIVSSAMKLAADVWSVTIIDTYAANSLATSIVSMGLRDKKLKQRDS